MTETQKFKADAKRLIKYNRANNNGRLDIAQVCKDIVSLFIRTSSVPQTLSRSVAYYWQENYSDSLSQDENIPNEEQIEKLCAFLSFLENSDEDEDLISDSDWQELAELVNEEAETLPLEVLQDLMKILVSKGAL